MENKIKVGEKTTVKYSPQLNDFIVSQLSEKELDLFIGLVTQMKDEGSTLQTIEMNQLKNMLGLTYKGKQLFNVLKKLVINLSAVRYLSNQKTEDLETLEIKNIFSVLKLTLDKKTVGNSRLDVKMSDDAVSLVNDLDRYVLFSLPEFTSIKGKNSKTAKILYKLLKQFRTTGHVEISLEKYRVLQGIEDKYKPIEITRTYVKSPVEKLKPFFKNLKFTKKTDKVTRKTTGYVFTFEPEQTNKPTPKAKKEYKKRPTHNEIATDWSKYAPSPTTENGAELNKTNDTLDSILAQLDSQDVKS